jgi:hypothetical protein
MNKLNITAFASASVLFATSSMTAQAIIFEDFTSPAVINDSGASSELGNGGSYTFGSWVYNDGNMGIDDAARGLGDGSNTGNAFSSVGVARIQDWRGTNSRATSVIFESSNFTDGQQYTVSFDVIGDELGADTGRFWLAEVSGYDADDGILIDGSHFGWATAKPFATSGAGGNSVVNFLADSPSNGVLLDGENVAGVTNTAFNFTYSAGTDIAFAVGTYNNGFAIDNFQIATVPEPSSYALFAGLLAFAGILSRRQKR